MEQLTVLHLTTELPYSPGGSGGSLRQFELLRALASEGHRPLVICPVRASEHQALEPVGSLGEQGITLFPVPRQEDKRREALGAVCSAPWLVVPLLRLPYYGAQARILWQVMAPTVRRVLEAERVDVLSVEHDFNAGWRQWLPRSIPKVLTLQNVTDRYYASRELGHDLESRLMRIEQRRMRGYADRHLPQFDVLTAVSHEEGDVLRQRYPVSVSVVPNGAHVSDVLPEPPEALIPPTVLFTGTMSHPPNRDAALWFGKEIWPLVKSRCPEARLEIVGRQPQAEVRGLSSANMSITVTGEVDTMEPYYRTASVVIAPLRSGGGTRLKILDAMAAGRPVVSTTMGAEGIPAHDGDQLIIADDEVRFAEAVISLLEDPGKAKALAGRGYDLVRQRYGWPALGAEWCRVLEGLAQPQVNSGVTR